MFEKKYEERLLAWNAFRLGLETAEDPLQCVIDLYKQAPSVSINVDPFDKKSWLDPWELLLENRYCEFCCVLGQCYSLQLTDRFSKADFEIHISVDSKKSESFYLLYVDKRVIGYDRNTHVANSDLPTSLESKAVYPMILPT